MSFARITISGTLLQAPEKRFTQNNIGVSILQLSVPMPPRRNQETPNLVVKVLCWRGPASYEDPQQAGGYGGQTAQAVAPAPAVNLNTLSADDFLTEDDLPF